MRVPMIDLPDGSRGPDLPAGWTGTATLTPDGDYELAPDPLTELEQLRARVAELEAQAQTGV